MPRCWISSLATWCISLQSTFLLIYATSYNFILGELQGGCHLNDCPNYEQNQSRYPDRRNILLQLPPNKCNHEVYTKSLGLLLWGPLRCVRHDVRPRLDVIQWQAITLTKHISKHEREHGIWPSATNVPPVSTSMSNLIFAGIRFARLDQLISSIVGMSHFRWLRPQFQNSS